MCRFAVRRVLLDWLQQLQEAMLEMREYEYSALVQIQSWSDVPRGVPLFESLVIVQNRPIVGQESASGIRKKSSTLQMRSAGASLFGGFSALSDDLARSQLAWR